MTAKLSYTMLKDWTSAGGAPFTEALGALPAGQKELLTSGGSMTEGLEGLSGGRVEVEVCLNGVTTLGEDVAAYMEEEPGTEAFEREVWLTVEGKRLIYARTIIPLVRIEEGLLAVLKDRRAEPLGKVLASLQIPFTKKKLEIGLVESAPLAEGFEKERDHPLAARRYILFNKNVTDRVIKAAVTEVFNPEIVLTT